ncbi:MAG: hypothetical protein NVS9B12_09400 [Vulcanimicrobiaceae bacterium]
MTPEALVEFAEELSRISAAGGGPKAFATHLAQTLQATVLIEDADCKHVATSGAGEAPAAIADIMDTSKHSNRKAVALQNGRSGLAMPIHVGETFLGWMVVVGAKLEGGEHLVRLAASAIGVELARESGGALGRKRTFWQRLLASEYTDAGAARDDAVARGIVLSTSYVGVALEAEVSDQPQGLSDHAELRRAAAEVFRSGEGDVALLESAGSLRILVPAAREVDAANIGTAASLFPKTFAKKFPSVRLAGGVGERMPLLQAGQSCAQAVRAMLIGRRTLGTGRVVHYADLGAYPLLFEGADPSQWLAFSQRVLAPLRAYDEKHQTELERTLALYFSLGENVKTAAAELNVHRHTVFYRLRQIAEICDCKLENPHDQLTLRLALAIEALTNPRGHSG